MTEGNVFSNFSNHKVHRYIFSKNKYAKDLLEGLLPLIDEDIAISNIRVGAENLIQPCLFAGKESYSDIVAVVNGDTIILIELYNRFGMEQEIKSMIYGCKIYGNQILTGKSYKTRKRVIIINLIRNSSFVEPEDINEYDLRHHKELKTYEEYFKDKHIRVANILLDKMATHEYTNSELANKGIDWLNLYVAKSYAEMEERAKERKVMSEAVEMVRKFLNDPIVSGAMTNEEMEHQQDVEESKKNGIKLGIKQGIVQGQKNKAIAIAKSLFEQGIPINTIVTSTGLSEEEIRKLQH